MTTYCIIIETPSGPHYFDMKRGTRHTRRELFARLRHELADGAIYKVRIFRPSTRGLEIEQTSERLAPLIE